MGTKGLEFAFITSDYSTIEEFDNDLLPCSKCLVNTQCVERDGRFYTFLFIGIRRPCEKFVSSLKKQKDSPYWESDCYVSLTKREWFKSKGGSYGVYRLLAGMLSTQRREKK